MAKYLITGANGFCGRHIVDFIPKNNEIYGISRNIPEELIIKHPHVSYERLNLLDHSSIFEFLREKFIELKKDAPKEHQMLFKDSTFLHFEPLIRVSKKHGARH